MDVSRSTKTILGITAVLSETELANLVVEYVDKVLGPPTLTKRTITIDWFDQFGRLTYVAQCNIKIIEEEESEDVQ